MNKEHTESCHVLLFYSNQLFASGLVRLLETRGLSLVTIDARSKDVSKRVREMRPRLILVEDDDDHVFAMKLSGILKGSRDVKVIRISSQDNRLSVYSSKQVMAYGPQDLFDAIDSLVESDDKSRSTCPDPTISNALES